MNARPYPFALFVPLLAGSLGAQSIVYTFEGSYGPVSPDSFGTEVDGIGDVDGDGFADLLVSAPGDSQAGVDAGRVVVLSGATGLVLREILGAPGDRLGTHASRAGDVDLDGTPDFVATDMAWRVYVVSGASGGVLHLTSALSILDTDAAGDVDADGFPDVVVGQATNDAVVYSGATGAVVRTFHGDPSFGEAVAGIGDANGDGYDDLAVGTPLFLSKHGKVELVSGKDGAILQTHVGTEVNQRMGFAVAPAGDADLDGVPDFIASAPTTNDSSQTGYATIFGGASGAAIITYPGGGLENLGWGLDAAGDMSLDGVDDVIVTTGIGGKARGYSPLTTTPLFQVLAPTGSLSLADPTGVGRVTADPRPEFAVSDPGGAGVAWVYSPTDLALTSDVHAFSLASGGARAFTLDASGASAGLAHLVLGTASGTSPGIPGFGQVLPLNPDVYLLHTLAHPNQPPLKSSLGWLDASGDAQASFTLPPGVSPAFAGIMLHHAFAVIDPVAGSVPEVSNAVPLSLLP